MRFRSDPAAIRGSIAPLVSPFTADGELDHLFGVQLVHPLVGVEMAPARVARVGVVLVHVRLAARDPHLLGIQHDHNRRELPGAII